MKKGLLCIALVALMLSPLASYAETKKEDVKKVYDMMSSGLYEKCEITCSQTSGSKGTFHGPFYNYNSLKVYRNVTGKLEVQNIAFLYDRDYKGIYHPELRPPILREWEPVKVNGNVYEYNYIYYADVASGHVAEFVNKIKGEIISITPLRVKEVIKTTSERGIRIPGERARFIGEEGTAECIFEWKLK